MSAVPNTIRSRWAPTPSGYLHVGNGFNFLLTWLLVRARKGTVRLRIDDLDAPRARREYLNDIFETLAWLGLDWDEGPRTAAEHQERYSQSLRLSRYEALLQRLVAAGKVFACTCSRKDIQVQSTDGQYPGTCLHKGLPLDTPGASWRFRTPPGTIIPIPDALTGHVWQIDCCETVRHFIVRRRDGIPAYHVASLADDLDFGINCIVRGEDLLPSTAAQLYLAEALQEPAFAATAFHHHVLLRDEQGIKLSKSAGSTSLRSWRESGKTAAAFYAWLGRHMGWSGTPDTLDALLERAQQWWAPV